MKFLVSAFLILCITVFCLPASGFTALFYYTTTLDGASESPPVATLGFGSAMVVWDSEAHTLWVTASFADLSGNTTVAHIHAPTTDPFAGTTGVAVFFPGFPPGVTSGSYDATFDLTDSGSYSNLFLNLSGGTADVAETALITAMNEGKAYVNIHTSYSPSGEIRGFLVAPLPTSLFLLGTGLAGLAGIRFRNRQL